MLVGRPELSMNKEYLVELDSDQEIICTRYVSPVIFKRSSRGNYSVTVFILGLFERGHRLLIFRPADLSLSQGMASLISTAN